MAKVPKEIRVLGIIPARGGSKSIPFKNIANVGGKPLIYYTIREAKKSKLLDAFIVSTDSPKIAAVAKRHGADAPFLRPGKFAKDNSPDIHFLRHALRWVKKHRGWDPELVVILRPTSPLRLARDIDRVIGVAFQKPCTMVRTVSPPRHNPFKMWHFRKDESLRPLLPTRHYARLGTDVPRQRLPKVYWQNAAVDAIRAANIRRGTIFAGPIYGVVMDSERSVDIDEPEDLRLAQNFLRG